MPRIARVVVPGTPHHVTQRGVRRMDVFFCDPASPWQRGSNENTNGLLRQYFPKGKTLDHVTQRDLNHAMRRLNGRPRKTLGFKTPAQMLERLLR